MRRYKSRIPIICTFAVTLTLSVLLFSSTAGAFSLSSILPTSKYNRAVEIQAKASVVKKKAESVAVIEQEVKKIAKKRVKLEMDVKQLESKILSLDSMFVRINRFASDAGGNAYVGGNCTWYVKSKRPDIGNFWGNANTWYSNAQSQGWNVGSKPKIGAIATTTAGYYGHVAYVERITNNGQTVVVSEMNYKGLGVVSTRVTSASEFRYIYELD